MEDNKEACSTCGPGGLKFSKHNGRGRVEVPEDFLANKLGSIDAQIAEGMAMAEKLYAAREDHDSAPATRPWPTYQREGPSAPTRPTGNFIFDALTMTAETQQGAPSRESQPLRGNQFTLAETGHASLLGIGPPPGPPATIQFTLAESGAAEVLPFVVQEGDGKEVEKEDAAKSDAAKAGSGIADWDKREFVRTDGPETDYNPRPEPTEDEKERASDPVLAAFLRVRDKLPTPPSDQSSLACPSKKPTRYAFSYHWIETIEVGVAATFDDAGKLAAGSIAASSAKDSIANRPVLAEKCCEAIGADTGLECDATCKLKCELVAAKYEVRVGIEVVEVANGDTKYKVTRYELHSVECVVDISCVA